MVRENTNPKTVFPPETDSMQHVKYIICLKDPARDLVGHFYHLCKLTSDLENRISFFDTLIEVSQFFTFFIKFIYFILSYKFSEQGMNVISALVSTNPDH
jgi:hypothetical protein